MKSIKRLELDHLLSLGVALNHQFETKKFFSNGLLNVRIQSVLDGTEADYHSTLGYIEEQIDLHGSTKFEQMLIEAKKGTPDCTKQKNVLEIYKKIACFSTLNTSDKPLFAFLLPSEGFVFNAAELAAFLTKVKETLGKNSYSSPLVIKYNACSIFISYHEKTGWSYSLPNQFHNTNFYTPTTGLKEDRRLEEEKKFSELIARDIFNLFNIKSPSTPCLFEVAICTTHELKLTFPSRQEIKELLLPDGYNLARKATVTNAYNLTLLHLACIAGDLDEVRALIEGRAQVNAVFQGDNTLPLHYAAIQGNPDVIRLLLENSATFNENDLNIQSPLLLACKNNHFEAAKVLLEHGFQKDIERGKPKAESPLYYATCHGNRALVELLLQYGADVHRWVGKNKIFHAAIIEEHLEVLQILITHASKNQLPIDINELNSDGESPLHLACQAGNKALTFYLIDNGAKLEQRNINNDSLPIHAAAFSENVDLVKELLPLSSDIIARSAECDLPDDFLLLYFACQNKTPALLEFLLKQERFKRYINFENRKNPKRAYFSPLHFVSYTGNTALIKTLVDAGAEINEDILKDAFLQNKMESFFELLERINLDVVDQPRLKSALLFLEREMREIVAENLRNKKAVPEKLIMLKKLQTYMHANPLNENKSPTHSPLQQLALNINLTDLLKLGQVLGHSLDLQEKDFPQYSLPLYQKLNNKWITTLLTNKNDSYSHPLYEIQEHIKEYGDIDEYCRHIRTVIASGDTISLEEKQQIKSLQGYYQELASLPSSLGNFISKQTDIESVLKQSVGFSRADLLQFLSTLHSLSLEHNQAFTLTILYNTSAIELARHPQKGWSYHCSFDNQTWTEYQLQNELKNPEKILQGLTNSVCQILQIAPSVEMHLLRMTLLTSSSFNNKEHIKARLLSGYVINQARAQVLTQEGLGLIHAACMGDDVPQVGQLLACGANINQASVHGSTPVYCAAQMGNLPMIELLVSKGAKVYSTPTSYSPSPLVIASVMGHTKVVEYFLTNKDELELNEDEINAEHKMYPSALFEAASGGFANIIALLLKHKANPRKWSNGNQPLHLACLRGHEAAIKAFINFDASLINVVNSYGHSPLQLLCQQEKQNVALLNFLLENGADPSQKELHGYLPLQIAVMKNHAEYVRILLENRLISNEFKNFNKETIQNTALFVGYQHNTSLEIFTLLLESVDFKIHQKNLNLLKQAILADKNSDEVKKSRYLGLLDYHITLEKIKSVPLHELSQVVNIAGFFSKEKSPKINQAKKLYDNCIKFCNTANREKRKILSCTIDEQLKTINKKEINQCFSKEFYWNVLHVACHHKEKELMEKLLAHGARINVEDKQGRTAVTIARQSSDAYALISLSAISNREIAKQSANKFFEYFLAAVEKAGLHKNAKKVFDHPQTLENYVTSTRRNLT